MAVYDRRLQDIYGNSAAEVSSNLVDFTFTFPRKDGKPNNVTIRVNRHVMKARLERVNARLVNYCAEHRTGYTLKTVYCFNWRRIRGSLSMSMHSGAIAIDVNPATNPMTYGALKTDMPRWFYEAFEAEGFTWGGRWAGRKDAMHFELRLHFEPKPLPYPLRDGHVFGPRASGKKNRHDGRGSARDRAAIRRIQHRAGVKQTGIYTTGTGTAVTKWKLRKKFDLPKPSPLTGPGTWRAMHL